MNAEKLKAILEKHRRWLKGELGGERAELRDANLRRSELKGADLRSADLRGAFLKYSDMRNADLRDAKLFCAYLYGCDLRGADLRNADLWDADLRFADLTGAKMDGANLREADFRYAKMDRDKLDVFPISCPECGSFIGFAAADHKIVKLQIPEDAMRTSARESRVCRCDKAIVLAIENPDGTDSGLTEIKDRKWEGSIVYRVGQLVEVEVYDENRENEWAPGVSFYITRKEAVDALPF